MRFGSLFGAVWLAAIKAEIRAASRRIAIAAISGLLIATAVCFAIAAFAVWLAREIGTVPALVVIAGGFLVLGLIVQGVARIAAGGRPRRAAPAAPPPPPPLHVAEPTSASERIPPGSELGVVATVAVAGFLLARQMLRR